MLRITFVGLLLIGASASCAAIMEPADGLPEMGDDPRALPDNAHFQASACGLDAMRERVCGGVSQAVDVTADAPFWDCPAEPKQLTSVGPSMLFYTDTKRLDFDRLMTLSYREQLNTNYGEEADRKGQCCYSRCTILPVTAKSLRGVPAGYHEKVQCVDAPQGGTSYPAAGYAECPNALAFGIDPAPFDADPFDADATSQIRGRKADYFADTQRCCYRTLEQDGAHAD